MILVQNCNDNSDINELDLSESVSNSIEFENYLVACFTFANELNIQNSLQIIGEVNGRFFLRKNTKKIDRQLFDNATEAYETLIGKFPEYRQMDNVRKNVLLNKISNKSKKIQQLIPIDKFSPTSRLKSGFEFPDVPGFFFQWFESIMDAFQACMNYSQTNNVESGGYIFLDGRALFIIDSIATDTSMNIPVWNNGAYATFHYHPHNTLDLSPQDSIVASFLQTYNIDSLIIITHDTIVGYGF
jgi:hypothetical protein